MVLHVPKRDLFLEWPQTLKYPAHQKILKKQKKEREILSYAY